MSNEVRFRVGNDGPVYSLSALDAVPLDEAMGFNYWMSAPRPVGGMGMPFTFADIEDAAEELSTLDEAAQRKHPMFLLVFGVTIWAARVAKGENVTLREGCKFSMSDLQLLPTPQDHTAPKAPKKSPKASDPVEQPEADDERD